MSNVNTQEKNTDMMTPVLGGLLGLMMVMVFAQMVAAQEEIVPEEVANLSGHVRDADTGDLISGASVALDGNVYTTGADGYYAFSGIPLGLYTLTVEKAGYEIKTTTSSLTEPRNYGQDIALIPLADDPTLAQLSGVVYDLAQETVVPIEGAKVKLNGSERLTDANGIYSFTDKPPGDYTLIVSKSGYSTATLSVTLTAGDNTRDVLLFPEGVPTAQFTVSELTITPTVVYVGESVEIGATVENIGDEQGSILIGDEPGCDFLLTIDPATYGPAVYPLIIPEIHWGDIMGFMMMVVFGALLVRLVRGK